MGCVVSVLDPTFVATVIFVLTSYWVAMRFKRLEDKVQDVVRYLAKRKIRPPTVGWIIEELEPIIKDWDDKDPRRNLLPDNKVMKMSDGDVSAVTYESLK